MQRARDASIEPGEVLTRVTIPPLNPGAKAAYYKQTERDSYDWPICDVAVVLTMEGQTVQNASIIMGWVAPTPRRAIESERLLIGNSLYRGLGATGSPCCRGGRYSAVEERLQGACPRDRRSPHDLGCRRGRAKIVAGSSKMSLATSQSHPDARGLPTPALKGRARDGLWERR